jgi:hypothetical protein
MNAMNVKQHIFGGCVHQGKRRAKEERSEYYQNTLYTCRKIKC